MNPNTISTDLSFSKASYKAVFLLFFSQWLRRWIKYSMKMPVKMKTKHTVARAQVGVSCKERYGVGPAPPSSTAMVVVVVNALFLEETGSALRVGD